MAEKRQVSEEQIMDYLKTMKSYSAKAMKGYGTLSGNLDSLYSGLDGLIEGIGGEQAKEAKDAHSKYKSSLKSASSHLKKASSLNKLVKQILSGSIGSQQELQGTFQKIQETYKEVVEGAIAMYQMLDPSTDVTKLINGIYLKLAEAKDAEIIPRFEKCVKTLKYYYIPEEVMQQGKKKAA